MMIALRLIWILIMDHKNLIKKFIELVITNNRLLHYLIMKSFTSFMFFLAFLGCVNASTSFYGNLTLSDVYTLDNSSPSGTIIILIPANTGFCYLVQVEKNILNGDKFNCEIKQVDNHFELEMDYKNGNSLINFECGVQCVYDSGQFTIPTDAPWPIVVSSSVSLYPMFGLIATMIVAVLF